MGLSQLGFWSKKMRNVLKPMKKKIQTCYILIHEEIITNMIHPITSWLGRFNPKSFEAWDRSPLTYKKYWTFFSKKIVYSDFDYIFLMKKKTSTFFLAKLFFIFLESSETHFDLVARKIGAKLIYRWIMVIYIIF